jgi:inorganic pyrophosphatase
MDLSSIKVGENPPHEVNVIIEIPQGGAPVKYEVDKKSGAMFVDRFLHTAMFYPANYGFIPHTLSEDGDPIDCMVIAPTPVAPGAVVRARPIGALLMEDEKGIDEKIIARSTSFTLSTSESGATAICQRFWWSRSATSSSITRTSSKANG